MIKRWSHNLTFLIYSLWPSDTIWWQGSRSTLVQVMACCLPAPSHYLHQCWLIIAKVQWFSSEGNCAWDITAISHKISLKITFLRFYWNLTGANELYLMASWLVIRSKHSSSYPNDSYFAEESCRCWNRLDCVWRYHNDRDNFTTTRYMAVIIAPPAFKSDNKIQQIRSFSIFYSAPFDTPRGQWPCYNWD